MGATPLHANNVPQRQSGVYPIFRRSKILPLISKPSDFFSIAKSHYLDKNYQEAESSLTELLSEDRSNKEAIALMIRIYSKTSRFGMARDLFEESRKLGYADKSIYTAFIVCTSSHRNRFEAYNIEGYNLIDEAKRSDNISPEAFASLISYYAKCGMSSIADSVFEKADRYRNVDVYSAYIFACCKSGQAWKAEQVLDRAQNEGIIGPQMFKSLVGHYSESKMTHDARRIFDWAIARDKVDSELCEMMLRGYLYHSSNEKIQNARNLFDFALEHGFVTHYLCSLMETGYADSKMPEKAEEIFSIAAQLDLADESLSSLVMRSYISAGRKKKANKFFSTNLPFSVANTNGDGLYPNPQLRLA